MADGDPQLRMEISALSENVRMLTYETMGIGHQLGRIADHLTGQRTGFEPPVETTAPDSVQSTSGGQPVDPEDPSWVPGSIAYAAFNDGSGGERAIRTVLGWHGERGEIRPETYSAYKFYRLSVVRTVELPVHDLEHPLRNSDGSEVDPDSGLPHHSFKPNAASHIETCGAWFGDHQCGLAPEHPAHTLTVGPLADLETVERMRNQIAVDCLTPYWSDRQDHLNSVLSYLDSLKDHLS